MLLFNSMKNVTARHILARIHAIRLSKRNLQEYAATLCEAHNWANHEMLNVSCGNCHKCHNCKEKEYQALHKFWVRTMRVLDSAEMRRVVVRYGNGVYAVIPPKTCMYEIVTKWRKR